MKLAVCNSIGYVKQVYKIELIQLSYPLIICPPRNQVNPCLWFLLTSISQYWAGSTLARRTTSNSYCVASEIDNSHGNADGHNCCNCPVSRTSLIATRFWVVVICPIIKCLTILEFFYFVWFVFIHHNFQFYFKLCTYCNILHIYLS